MKRRQSNIKKIIKKKVEYTQKKTSLNKIVKSKSPYKTKIDNELKSTPVNKDVTKDKVINEQQIIYKPKSNSNEVMDDKMKRRLGQIQPVNVELVKSNKSKLINNDVVSNLITIEDRQPISIIVTAYQTQNYIEECLDSIEKQTYFDGFNNYEILVGVDGCEKTLNKLMKIRYKYRNLQIYLMESNKGTYVTSNTLLNLVKFENIIRFDSDDIMLYNMVNEIMLVIENNDVIKFKYINFSNKEVYTNKKVYSGGVIFYKKKIIDEFGGYMPWICAADGELLLRFANNNIKIFNLNKSLFLRRKHSNALTINNNTSMKSVMRKKYHLLKKSLKKEVKSISREVNGFVEIL